MVFILEDLELARGGRIGQGRANKGCDTNEPVTGNVCLHHNKLLAGMSRNEKAHLKRHGRHGVAAGY